MENKKFPVTRLNPPALCATSFFKGGERVLKPPLKKEVSRPA